MSASLAIQDVGAFAVARLEEGMSLRAAGIRSRIVLLEGVFSRSQLEDAAHDDVDLVVHDPRQIELLEQSGGAARFAIWIKIDTGMNRLGSRRAILRRRSSVSSTPYRWSCAS